MDLELVIWVLVFVGGYSVILGYLLWVAMRRRPDDAPGVHDRPYEDAFSAADPDTW